jgi:hypothetical protein
MHLKNICVVAPMWKAVKSQWSFSDALRSRSAARDREERRERGKASARSP